MPIIQFHTSYFFLMFTLFSCARWVGSLFFHFLFVVQLHPQCVVSLACVCACDRIMSIFLTGLFNLKKVKHQDNWLFFVRLHALARLSSIGLMLIYRDCNNVKTFIKNDIRYLFSICQAFTKCVYDYLFEPNAYHNVNRSRAAQARLKMYARRSVNWYIYILIDICALAHKFNGIHSSLRT